MNKSKSLDCEMWKIKLNTESDLRGLQAMSLVSVDIL